MNIDLSKAREKIRKQERWANLLDEILADPDGDVFLTELIVSSNSHGDSSAQTASPFPAPAPAAVPKIAVRRNGTKKSRLATAVIQAADHFNNPFGARDLLSVVINQRGYNFTRDPMLELAGVLRQLVAENKLKVVKEKIGRGGRLYTKVLP